MKTLFVSVYGDGALLDATTTAPGNLRRDNEPQRDENGDAIEDADPEPTAILSLSGVPKAIRTRAVDYARRGNCGAAPYSDGYEAMECVHVATDVEVLDCSVPWSHAGCKRLGGCFLCGGLHDWKVL
jgi:hypothetical protein